jgi:DNA mismatch repair ATPase MutS
MDHVEAGVLDLVADLFPDIFARLREFSDRHRDYLDPVLSRFDREVQFYLAYLEHIAPLRAAGLSFSYPRVSAESKQESAADTFDLALAHKLTGEKAPVVCNDFALAGPDRIIVVSGPNQGGKSTFARTFGQLHYLALLGCLVPGREVRLFRCDQILTHFEREELVDNLTGKLHDDLMRIHAILGRATSESVVIMNEIFTSTTLADAVYLSRNVLERIAGLDALAVCVTFLDELASFGPSTVSMVATVVPDNPALRTFKIVRKPADGFAYAAAIAAKYGLNYQRVRDRVAR